MSRWLVALLLLHAATVASAQAPHLDYSILLGGTDWDEGTQIAVDATGHAWVVGATYTWDFPFTTPQPEGIYHDLFIARLSPAGAFLSAVPFGGSETDYLHAMHLDTAGNLYLVGQTWSPDFPMTHLVGPPGAIDNGAFVSKVDPNGNLVYSTRFRGTPNLAITDVAVDAQGQAHVVGKVPVSGAPDMFIAKLSADGSSFLYSLQLGGSSSDEAWGIALDSAGNAHVAGFTGSTNFPQAQRLPQNGAAGLSEAVVLKLAPDGSRLYSKLLGGGGHDAAQAIAIDPAGNALVYGGTGSPDFPVRNALQPQANFLPDDWDNWYKEPYDTFLTRLDPAGALLGSTYLGGTSGDSPVALSVDPAGFIYLLGSTFSAEDFPLRDPLPAQLDPPWDYGANHVTLLNPQASEILFSTFVDGTDGDEHGWVYGMAVDAAGSIYLSGTTHDVGFPVVGPSPLAQPEYFYDAFVLKIDARNDPPVCTAATVSPAVLGTPYGWFRTVTVQGLTDPDGDSLSAIVTRITQDELLSRPGEPDARGVGTARPSVRADRMSSGDGRVYHLSFTASDPGGATCSGRVTVCVPVDPSRPTCRDGGARFDSSGAGR